MGEFWIWNMWCDQAKWVWSQKIWFLVCWHFLLGCCLGFNLVKTPQMLGTWFQRYKQMKDWTNNKKQKKLLALFGYILKTVFASSDSFCLITSHISLSFFKGKNKHMHLISWFHYSFYTQEGFSKEFHNALLC